MKAITLQNLVEQGVKLTPMMEQFYAIKKLYNEHLVLFRMGDFYELFFEDAVHASKVLNITQTHRGKLGEIKIPMAGIPHHAASAYIDRLTSVGLKVAICEQVEDPKEAKGIVKRAVTQVVSPSIPYDLDKADSKEARYMMAASKIGEQFFLISLDFTTGEFEGRIISSKQKLLEAIQLRMPKEWVTFMGQWEDFPEWSTLMETKGILKTHLSKDYFDEQFTEIYISKLIPNYKRDRILKKSPGLLGPMGALAYYVLSTQQLDELFHLRPFRIINPEGHLQATLPTLQGLEILPKNRETYKDSLLGFMDKTKCSMGARSLRHLFLEPLMDLKEIQKRQAFIGDLVTNPDRMEEIREILAPIRDIERILAKVSTQKMTASDLVNLKEAVLQYNLLIQELKQVPHSWLRPLPNKKIIALQELSDEIIGTINEEIGASLDKGNLIKPGFNKSRDRLARLTTSAQEELTQLEERYRQETGILKLRVKSNNVAGYFIEVSKLHSDKMPKHFQRRQTLVNSERYSSDELISFEKDMLSAKDKLETLERKIFRDLVKKVAQLADHFLELSQFIGLLDAFTSLAWVAFQEDFKKPTLTANKKVLELKGAWHPLIKSIIKDQFICHDIQLDKENYFGLITGPNMAGKTTVMREVAIIQHLAQLGSFVPCDQANLGVCDYLFSRLGASDDILKGQSTFMVEMAETAEILRHASEHSLVILDEVGRGTSTFDGLSIAWALVEHFVNEIKPITLFATHYHELIEVAEELEGAKNFTVETHNENGDVQFLYRLIEQGASQSFGLYVAKLAGIPQSILKRSENLLGHLEDQDSQSPVAFSQTIAIPPEEIIPCLQTLPGTQLCFLGQENINPPQIPEYLTQLEEEISKLDPMHLTPIQALSKLDNIKQQMLQGKALH